MRQQDPGGRGGVLGGLLVVAVGLAFADASVVVLALPSVYGELGTTIVQVSWVLTGYALVVAVVAAGLALAHRRLRPIGLTVAGLAVFAVGCLVCGLSGDLTALLVGRCVQGAGTALLLTGALPVLAALQGAARGRAAWGTAATAGLAVGPALGGTLTDLFDWRVIFYAQVPVALAAALALPLGRRSRRATDLVPGRRPALPPLASFVLLSGALVGVLFLGVLLVIEVWRLTPLTGAAVVSALPAGMLLVRPLTRLGPAAAVGGGALLLAGGLAALALLPAAEVAWAATALAICGFGLGLLSPVLDRAAVGAPGGLRDGSLAVGARHAGLVVGLVLIAPVLAGSLQRGAEKSALAGTAAVLDARVPVDQKVKISLAVRDQLAANPRGQVPDLRATVDRAGADPAAAGRVGDELAYRVTAVLTRSFRPAFGLAAGLGAAVLVPGLVLVWRRRRTADPAGAGPAGAGPAGAGSAGAGPAGAGPAGAGPAGAGPAARSALVAGLVVLLVGTGGVLAGELAAGAADYGRYPETDGCAAPADSYPGGGLDPVLQRIALSALNGAACELRVSRERLVLALGDRAPAGTPRVDRPGMERALRSGLVRAVDDAERRGDVPGWTAGTLRYLARHAPVTWLTDRLGLPG